SPRRAGRAPGAAAACRGRGRTGPRPRRRGRRGGRRRRGGTSAAGSATGRPGRRTGRTSSTILLMGSIVRDWRPGRLPPSPPPRGRGEEAAGRFQWRQIALPATMISGRGRGARRGRKEAERTGRGFPAPLGETTEPRVLIGDRKMRTMRGKPRRALAAL